jgi:hypothetical protein
MTDNGNSPNRIFIGSFESGVNTLVIPSQVLERANDQLDRERQRREAAAARAKLQVLQSARNRGRLRKALARVFRGHRRIPQ